MNEYLKAQSKTNPVAIKEIEEYRRCYSFISVEKTVILSYKVKKISCFPENKFLPVFKADMTDCIRQPASIYIDDDNP